MEAEKTVFWYGLKERSIECHNNISCPVYLRDASSVSKEQTLETMDNEFLHSFHEGRNFLHITNAENGIKACPDVERFFKCSKDSLVSRKTAEIDGIESIVGCHQVFRDKSQVCLPSDALKSYPLHIILL